MATKKPAAKKPAAKKSTAVATHDTQGGELSLDQRLKSIAAKGRHAISIAPSDQSETLSFRQGMMTYKGRRVKGDAVTCVILHPGFERAYFPDEFDPKRTVPPACYSFDNEAPHEMAADPQADTCESCPMNEWGSADRGRGKACKEGLRCAILILPEGQAATEEWARSAPIVSCKFSVMNTKAVQPTIQGLYDDHGHPCRAVVKLSVEPDPVNQIRNDIEELYAIDEPAILEILLGRTEKACELVEQPYPVKEEAEKKPTNQRRTQRTRSF